MSDQRVETNPYALPCIICSRILIPGSATTEKELKLEKLIGVRSSNQINYPALVCPQGHNYKLTDITSILKNNLKNVDINEELMIKIANSYSIKSIEEILNSEDTKIYNVSYSQLTPSRIWFQAFCRNYRRKGVSPKYHHLDRITIYICATIRGLNGEEDKRILFEVVEEAKNLNEVHFHIINIEEL
jgi:TusA-related sulfurtransferase